MHVHTVFCIGRGFEEASPIQGDLPNIGIQSDFIRNPKGEELYNEEKKKLSP
jgi:hypothetical protein